MSNYIDQNLMPGERVCHRAQLSLWPYAWWIALGVITAIAIVGLVILAAVWMKFASTELAVTDRRIMVKTGFISRQTVELNLSRLESIQVHQSIFGRICNYGTIIIAGAGNPQAPVRSIREALAAQDRLAKEDDERPAAA